MPSALDLSCYQVARRFLQEGRRDWTLVLVGELMLTVSGRPLALRLLEEMYPELSGTQATDAGSPTPAAGVVALLAAHDQTKREKRGADINL